MKLSTIPLGFSSLKEYHDYIGQCESALYEHRQKEFEVVHIQDQSHYWGVKRVMYGGHSGNIYSSPMYTLRTDHTSMDEEGWCRKCESVGWYWSDDQIIEVPRILVPVEESQEYIEAEFKKIEKINTWTTDGYERYTAFWSKYAKDVSHGKFEGQWFGIKRIAFNRVFAAHRSHP